VAKSIRDYERDYLAASCELDELLQRRARAQVLQRDIEKLHARLIELGVEVVTGATGREHDYMATLRQMQFKLQEKAASYALAEDIEKLHARMIEIGHALGWQSPAPEAEPEPAPPASDKFSKLQRQMEDLRGALA
jgi:hypothetical protein